MVEQRKGDGLCRSDLIRQTGAPGYVIDYLRDAGRLPLLVGPKGRGYSVIFCPESVDIVKRHLARRRPQATDTLEAQGHKQTG